MKKIDHPKLREENRWASAIAEAALAFFNARQGLLAVKPRGVHRLVRRFLVDSGAIEHLGRLRDLQVDGVAEAISFREDDDRRHLYLLNPELMNDINRWARLNAPPLVARYRKGVGLRIEPKDTQYFNTPDWPWYPE